MTHKTKTAVVESRDLISMTETLTIFYLLIFNDDINTKAKN